MRNETRVFGYIEVPTWSASNKKDIDEFNWSAINNLPEEGEWPWLIRGMFAQSPELVSYRGCIIHFGAAIKGIDEEWEQWLNKFESLLRNMYWHSVELKLKTEYVGDHELSWVAILPEKLNAVEEWEFFGGPRRFE